MGHPRLIRLLILYGAGDSTFSIPIYNLSTKSELGARTVRCVRCEGCPRSIVRGWFAMALNFAVGNTCRNPGPLSVLSQEWLIRGAVAATAGRSCVQKRYSFSPRHLDESQLP